MRSPLRGDWDGLIRKLQNLPKRMQEELRKAVQEAAFTVEAVAVGHLKNQDLGWEPLTERYLRWKKRRGYSEKTLIRTATYFRAIAVEEQADGLGAFVGVKRGVARERNGQDIVDIAAFHEEGTDRIPARPLWQPTYEETRHEVADRITRAALEALR